MKKKPATKRGGARKGAGRKSDGEEPKVSITVALDKKDLAKLDRLTGNRSRWVGEKIKQEPEPKMTTKIQPRKSANLQPRPSDGGASIRHSDGRHPVSGTRSRPIPENTPQSILAQNRAMPEKSSESEHYSKQHREFTEAIERALDEAMKHKPKSYTGLRLCGVILIAVEGWLNKRFHEKP